MTGGDHDGVNRSRCRLLAQEEGSATVEFLAWVLLLVVPVVYLVLALAQVEAASFAVASAADAASRVLEVDASPEAMTRARAAAGLALADQGLEGDGTVELRCRDTSCTTAVLRVETALGLPGLDSTGGHVAQLHAERTVTLPREHQ